MENTCRIKQKIKIGKADSCKFILVVVFIALVIFPLLRMLMNIDVTSMLKIVTSELFIKALVNSITVTLISTIITVIIAFFLSICIERSNVKFKGILSIIFVLPMLIPSISHGMGLVILFGNNGVLTKLLNLNTSIYGMSGIVIGSVMYAFPIAFLMLNDIMKYEDYSPYEASKVLGVPNWRQFTSITFPYLRKPLISVIFAVFTMIITDYGVPLMIGGKFLTIPVIMYQEVIGQLDFTKGSVYGMVLLVPALIAFLFDLLNKDKGNDTFVTRKFAGKKNKFTDIIAYMYCAIVSICVIIPIFAFCLLSFTTKYPIDLSFTVNNVIKAVNMNVDTYLVNSVSISILVAIIGTTTAFITAYLTARMKSKVSKFLHLTLITSAAIPGIVLGLSYVLTFKGSFIYGTLIMLVMVNLIHFIASPYLMMYNSMNKLNDNLESVGQILGISRLRMLKDVFLPQSKLTIMEMFAYFFVNSMMTISAVSFLATTNNKPVSLMINQFEAQMQLELAAVVSIAILMINIIIKGIIYLLKRVSVKQETKQSINI